MADLTFRFDAVASPQMLKPPAFPVPMSRLLVVPFWKRRPAPVLASKVLPRRIRLDWLAPTIWTKIPEPRFVFVPFWRASSEEKACGAVPGGVARFKCTPPMLLLLARWAIK